uniref:Uncharacterized protein n=1 Tax=Arundo donax TaxID=35708 RepID=A0A0A9D121_ARUDO
MSYRLWLLTFLVLIGSKYGRMVTRIKRHFGCDRICSCIFSPLSTLHNNGGYSKNVFSTQL